MIKNLERSKNKNKKAILSLSLILMFAMTLTMAFFQTSLAQVGIPQPVKTAGYISVAPQLVGEGQQLTVNLWVFPTPQGYGYSPAFNGYGDIEVTFTKPDGTKDTFKPVDGTGMFDAGRTESLGTLYFYYTPDAVGDWSVTFSMPPQNITDSSGTLLYQACTSEPAHFTVTEEIQLAGLLNGYPWAELPNENTCWDYPISSNNREWNQISGDWLLYGVLRESSTGNSWQPYGSAPNTAHIVWDSQIGPGGLVGGEYGSISYAISGGSPGTPGAIVMGGKIFMNIPNAGKFECIDLTTGQVLYLSLIHISEPTRPY